MEALAISGDDEKKEEGCGLLAQVDPFLVEAFQNPRHRLTVLRMELDIQKFMQNHDQYQFEFQQFPTSYLRCAAHRVAQHYGLRTLVENGIDGLGSRILVIKTPESRFPAIRLSEIPVQQGETENFGQVKLAVRTRPSKASAGDIDELGLKISPVRTVEEREEEYEKARARIFSGSSDPELAIPMVAADERGMPENSVEQEFCRTWAGEIEKTSMNDGASRVAIFRDREKDRNDPDYDRSYDRYARSHSFGQGFNMGVSNAVQPTMFQYGSCFSQVPRLQPSVNFKPSNPVMSPFCAFGRDPPLDAVYMQWPSPAMVYAHSYDHFRHTIFQAPFYQQPLSFERSHSH